jgi:DNA-binding PadR family transcriptional regulator
MRAEELKGHLDALLLAALETGPRHGYAVIEAAGWTQTECSTTPA